MSLSNAKNTSKVIQVKEIAEFYPKIYKKELDNFTKACGRTEFTGHEFWDLKQSPLKIIPTKHTEAFLVFLVFEIIIDEIIYTYYPKEYSKFRLLTNYPKLYFCGHGMASPGNPWGVLHKFEKKILLNEKIFRAYVKRFEAFQIEFFEENKFNNFDWEQIKVIIRSDKDIRRKEIGELFVRVLRGE